MEIKNINQNYGVVNGNVTNNYNGLGDNVSFEDIVHMESFALEAEEPKIFPVIERPETESILNWILTDYDSVSMPGGKVEGEDVGLVVGMPGIGKTVVLNTIFSHLTKRDDVFVIGLKSDRLLFLNDVHRIPYLMKMLDDGIDQIAAQGKRVVILADQIDALSATLSGDRNIIRNIISFLLRQGKKSGVKVVFSCRNYDLSYNPNLYEVGMNSRRWTIAPIPAETVKMILKENDFNENLTPKILDLLGNPLHLYLFLQVKDSIKQAMNVESCSLESLYERFWNLKIRFIYKQNRIIEFLDSLCRKMYEEQKLSLPECRFNEYQDEIDYLVSNGFLVKECKGNKLAFFHQTLFDYVYARRFVERGESLYTDLNIVHQGLFLRPRIRSVMAYLRNHDDALYISTFTELLKKDDRGRYGCRFHILHMLLTTLAFIKDPMPEEKNLFREFIATDSLLFATFVKAIHSDEWMRMVEFVIKDRGGFKDLDFQQKATLYVALDNLILENSAYALELFKLYFQDASEKERESLIDILRHNANSLRKQTLLDTIKWLQNEFNSLRTIELTEPLFGSNPEFAAETFERDLKIQLSSYRDKFGSFDTDNHLFNHLLKNFGETNPELITDLWIKLFLLIASEKSIKIDSCCVALSPLILLTHYAEGCIYTEHIGEYLMRKIEEKACHLIEKGEVKGLEIVERLLELHYEPIVYTALKILVDTASKTYIFSYKLLNENNLYSNEPAWVHYEAIELIKNIIPYLSDEQKGKLIEGIMGMKEDSTPTKLKLEKRLEYGIPIAWQGHEKGKLLAAFPTDDLHRLNSKAYQKFNEFSRKFKDLENTPPSTMSSSVGFATVKGDKRRIKERAWLSMMKKYTTDYSQHFDTPTLTGICRDLTSEVTASPDKFISLFHEAVKDSEVPMRYCISMLEGFVKTGKLDLMDSAIIEILTAINNDVNSDLRGFSLHSLLFALMDAINSEKLTDVVVSLLCKAAIEYDDSCDDEHLDNTHDLLNFSINRTRGNACYKLVECIRTPKYTNQILEALEKAAASDSVSTRGAILINLAACLNADRNRTLQIFLSATRDHHPAIMNMPLHNYNPIIYLIKTNFSDLRNYFEEGIKAEECHGPIAEALFLAWLWRDNQDAKEFLDKMISYHQEAKDVLMRFFNRNNLYERHSIQYIKTFIKEENPSKELAEALDSMFADRSDLKDYFPELVETYSLSTSVKISNRTFYKSLVAYSLLKPQKALEAIENSLGNYCKSNPDFEIWNSITDVLLQSYNGIYSLHDKNLLPILDKAIDILDYLLMNSIASSRLAPFFHKLDNE